MSGQEPRRNWDELQFFYRELTVQWEDRGLEQQAYILVKHLGFSFTDVGRLTYLERLDFMELYQEENEKRKEELKKIQSKGKR